MARALETSKVEVWADATQCSLQFDPVGKTNFTDKSCDIAKTFLSNNGVNYDIVDKGPGTIATVHVGDKVYQTPDPSVVKGDDRKKAIAEFQGRLQELNITAEVTGRGKHLWSIYEKMVQKGKEFDDIFDLIAIRVIVDSVKIGRAHV